MESKNIVWDDVPVFLAVARSGSLSGAASALSLGLATVSRRVERLEACLGRPLFLRHHTGYRLTEEGAALVERAEEMEAAARAFGAARSDPCRSCGRLAAGAPSLADLKIKIKG